MWYFVDMIDLNIVKNQFSLIDGSIFLSVFVNQKRQFAYYRSKSNIQCAN